jgi:L-lactate permease
MSSVVPLLLIVWPFWVVATIGAVRTRRSWFPFTLIVPAVFTVTGLCLDRLFYPLGIVIAGAVHTVLWVAMIWVLVTDRISRK